MARAFDLILHEYAGYTDETLLDTTLGRIRQMVDVISERRLEEAEADRRLRLQIAQMQTQTLAMMLSGLAQTKKGGSAMQAAAGRIDFLSALTKGKPKTKELPRVEKVMGAFGVRADSLGGVRG